MLTGNAAANRLDGGAGADTMIGGAGNDTYYVDATTDVVTELAGEGTDTIMSSVTLTSLAANVDTLDGKAGNDTLNGGAGADTHLFGIGYGADVIADSDATAGVKDVVKFGAGIAQADLKFTQSGNSLVATIKSTSESLTMQDWYLSANNRVEEFRFNDGTVLTNVQAQGLVGAMAAFNPSGAGEQH